MYIMYIIHKHFQIVFDNSSFTQQKNTLNFDEKFFKDKTVIT